MILNKSFLRQVSRNLDERTASVYINESQNFSFACQYDLFISHSFADRSIIVGLNHIFKKAGYKVYIDWIVDKNLDRNNVTYDTAAILKRRIQQSKGLAYVATANTTDSKWCPWELGMADGMKGKACILPVIDDDSFSGVEYLGLYPYLEYEEDYFYYTDLYLRHDGDKTSLRRWLNTF